MQHAGVHAAAVRIDQRRSHVRLVEFIHRDVHRSARSANKIHDGGVALVGLLNQHIPHIAGARVGEWLPRRGRGPTAGHARTTVASSPTTPAGTDNRRGPLPMAGMLLISGDIPTSSRTRQPTTGCYPANPRPRTTHPHANPPTRVSTTVIS